MPENAQNNGGKDNIIAGIGRAIRRNNRVHGRGSLVSFMVVLSMIAVLVGVLWYSYPRETETYDRNTVPLVRADDEPYRTKPEDPGGMNVPHRDSTIFEGMREGRNQTGGNGRIENLLAEDEKPMPRDQLFAGLNTRQDIQEKAPQNLFDEADTPDANDLTETMPPQPRPPANETEEDTRALVKSVLEEHDKTAAEKKQQDTATNSAAPEARPEPKPETVEPAAGSVQRTIADSPRDYFVQLASLGSRDAALSAWKKLEGQHASVLKGEQHRIRSADIPGRGTFYRVQAGPYTKDRANDVCGEIKSAGAGGCLVVKR